MVNSTYNLPWIMLGDFNEVLSARRNWGEDRLMLIEPGYFKSVLMSVDLWI